MTPSPLLYRVPPHMMKLQLYLSSQLLPHLALIIPSVIRNLLRNALPSVLPKSALEKIFLRLHPLIIPFPTLKLPMLPPLIPFQIQTLTLDVPGPNLT